MDCSCEIDIDHDGGPDVYTEKIVTARKKHICCECRRDIPPGEEYENVTGCWDGSWSTYKTCIDCKSMRDTFFNAWHYTAIWETFRDEFGYYDSIIPESCISELTPHARAKVCEFIESGWED